MMVDYIGIMDMNIALKRYAQGDIKQSITLVKDELDIILHMFGEFGYSVFTTGTPLEPFDCLNRGAEPTQSTKKQ